MKTMKMKNNNYKINNLENNWWIVKFNKKKANSITEFTCIIKDYVYIYCWF